MLMGKTDYFDKYYTGKIYKFIENNYKLGDKGFIGCDIDKQLINGDPNTSTFATFDIKSFPMHDSWSIDFQINKLHVPKNNMGISIYLLCHSVSVFCAVQGYPNILTLETNQRPFDKQIIRTA
eukprot:274156_1